MTLINADDVFFQGFAAFSDLVSSPVCIRRSVLERPSAPSWSARWRKIGWVYSFLS